MEKHNACRDCFRRLLHWVVRWARPCLAVLIQLMGLAAIVFGAVSLFGGTARATPLEGHEVDVLFVTFGVLVFYAFHTYRLAKEPYNPIASFWLDPKPIARRVVFILRSHCKRAMDCWCKVEIHCKGVVVSPPRFYSQEVPWYLPPLHTERGNFSIDLTLRNGGIDWEDVRARELQTGRPQIHIKVRFGYGLPNRQVTWLMPIYYYYRTADDRVVLDVAGVERTACGVPP